MKRLFLLASCLAATAASAADVSIGHLPACGYADTETSTNVPFAFVRSGVRNFEFDLCLAGTPSNNVQLAFGRDADSDGVLSVDETDMSFGWDCGEWRIVNQRHERRLARLCVSDDKPRQEPQVESARPPRNPEAPRLDRERRRALPRMRRLSRAMVLHAWMEPPASYGSRG